ncbi:MAG: sigma-70 family RNA polymerase sigma factor [Bryobacteraceae bacterium]
MEDKYDSEVTRLLERISTGDAAAKEELMAAVYAELRRLAAGQMKNERPGHTWQPTALVHEAYTRMLGNRTPNYADRAHFFATASQVMRRLLVDYARKRGAGKRGAGMFVTLNEEVDAEAGVDRDVLLVDDVLEELAKLDPRATEVVEMKYFGGMTESEIGQALGIHEATVRRDWKFARAWLAKRLAGETRRRGASA